MQITNAILRNCTIKSSRPPFFFFTHDVQFTYHKGAVQYIDVMSLSWYDNIPTNITLCYWVSTTRQVAIKTNKSVCPALTFRRRIVSCLQPVNTVVYHLLSPSRGSFPDSEKTILIMSPGVSQVSVYNVIYISTRKVCATNFWVWSVKDVGVYYQAPRVYSVFLEMQDWRLALLPLVSHHIETSFLQLWDSSTHPPHLHRKKKIFSWVALLAFPCTFDPWLILGTLNLHVLASAASVYSFHLIKAQY